jgi:hypothetical protein
MDRVFNCENYRKFGAEIELNTLNGLIKKLDPTKGEIPFGSAKIALLIRNALKKTVEIQSWDHNYNNDFWIVKPDSSCGIEVCTPVLKGWTGLKDLIQIVEIFRSKNIQADERCSFHVHVNIGDLNINQLGSIIAWYIKCEHVFMDAFPSTRKLNRYCQMLGMTNLFSTDTPLDPLLLINSISGAKYYSLNTYHFVKGGGFSAHNNRKKTIEFRIGENSMCTDGEAVKNWIRLLLHFVEVAKDQPMPPCYEKGNPSTGLLWMEPDEVFRFLKFNEPCSGGLQQVKKWFVNRILKNGFDTDLPGVWSNKGRSFARKNFLKLLHSLDINCDCEDSRENILYDKKYIV